MPKSFVEAPLSESTGYIFGRMTLGIVWGGFAGALIGTGICMTIGLFSSSAILLISGVITISSILGAIFRQIMANLLSDDVALTGYAHSYNAAAGKPAVTDLCEHEVLTGLQKKKIISNQEVMAKINKMRSGSVALPPYRPDAQIFELIISAAHKSGTTDRQAGGGR